MTVTGKIIKGIAGFYYVACEDAKVYECKAKGSFRKDKVKPLVGDDVTMEILSENDCLGNIVEIQKRKNQLIRPAVANVDQALVVFAMAGPAPNLGLLDRFLIQMEHQGVPTVIVFNKRDLVDEAEEARLRQIYESAGYDVVCIAAKPERDEKEATIIIDGGDCVAVQDGSSRDDGHVAADVVERADGTDGESPAGEIAEEDVEKIKAILQGKVSTVAGPSGVGKSTLINALQADVVMETGTISEKIERGKHTTRHSQLIPIDADTYIFDTPGFSSLEVTDLTPEQLQACFIEFAPFEGKCRFLGCAHLKEPDCKVKDAVEAGVISRYRYEDYVKLYEECKSVKRY